MTPPRTVSKAKELSGRTVLFCLLGFFAVVGAANAVLIRAATSTFGGVETSNAYKAGLAFNRDIAAAQAQESRHWAVDANLLRISAKGALLSVTVRDHNGAPPAGIELHARLSHPADARRDHALTVREFAPGVFSGTIETAPGQWDLVIEVMRGDERMFLSKSRVILR